MAQIRANGVNLEVEMQGPADGIPFVMIHGFGQQLTAWPAEFLDGLAAGGLRLIRLDNRDVGLSQKWDGQIPDIAKLYADQQMGRKPQVPYTLDDMAADVAGMLEALGLESAHIMGCSMGGMIAQLVALNHPEKTRSLISMFSTTGDPGLPPSTPEAINSLLTQAKGEDRASLIAHVLVARRAYASTAYPYNEERIAAQVGTSYDRMYYPEGTQRHWSAILVAPPRTERLKSLKLPALVLHGSADTLVRPQAGRHTAECIEGSEYHEIDGWGHDMPLGVIPMLLRYILDFVRRAEKGRA